MRSILVGAAVALATMTNAISASAQAPAPPPVCKRLTDQIESALMDISNNRAAGLTDDSAPRANMRAAEDTAKYSEIQTNIALMAAHRCPAYPRPVNGSRYLNSAVECRLARMKQSISDKEAPVECKRDTWKPLIAD